VTPAALLAAPALGATYTWGSHALTLGCRWRGERAGRITALTFDLDDADGVPGAGGRLVEALPAMIESLRSDGYALAPLRDVL